MLPIIYAVATEISAGGAKNGPDFASHGGAPSIEKMSNIQ
jgi:hypothetical protein